jgi:hypothetical protein
MATIDDFGGTTDPLNAPPLGGPSGWAAAVRDYLKGMVVQKAGDVMSGSLQVLGGINTPSLIFKESLNLHESGGELVVWDVDRSTYGKAFVDTPTTTMHAATKGYVDGKLIRGAFTLSSVGSVEAGSTYVARIPFGVTFAGPPQVVATVINPFNSAPGYYGPGATSPHDPATVQVGGNGTTTTYFQAHFHFPKACSPDNAIGCFWYAWLDV